VKEYLVTYEGSVRETYCVIAESEAEAREKWSDTEPMSSEVTDGEVTSIEVTDS
jgi:hypothetical protein